jgi:hypothetical protein
MPKRFLFNDTNAPKLMGGKLVPPGEGREVDDVHLPPGEALTETGGEGGGEGEGASKAGTGQGQASSGPTDEQLRANLVEELKKPLGKLLPELNQRSSATLALMAELENASETPRKGLLGRIAELQLERAQTRAGGAPT